MQLNKDGKDNLNFKVIRVAPLNGACQAGKSYPQGEKKIFFRLSLRATTIPTIAAVSLCFQTSS